MRRARVFVLSAAALAAASTLVGCGAGSVDSSAVAKAATKTAKVSGAHFDATVEMTIGQTGPLHMRVTGDENVQTRSLHATLDMGEVARLAGPQAGSPSDWEGEMIVDGSHGGLVAYMRMPLLARVLPAGKTWVSIDIGKALQKQGVDLSQLLQQSAMTDPAQSLQLLQSVADLKQAGSEQIGGASTTRYDGAIDVEKVAAKYGGKSAATILDTYKQLGVSTIPVSVWIGDDDGYVHRLHMTFASTIATAGKAEFGITFDLSKFGEAVSVTPPAADQVADVTTLGGTR